MAAGENKWVKAREGDLVVLSSHAIPGNETNVGKVIDGLCRSGAEVVHSALASVHASGHAMRDELKLLISIAKPRAFIPVHGEYRHLMHHARLATDLGVGRRW
jgi:ribonuclease J